ncbi:hypothetical protein AMECASPLE_029433 [Ameca splendens]|uniref:Uncharacterized protein n=1 Tax=Ameca splendens TaxID=208324 RepID=A0ABV0ZRY6_9TELE
MKYFRPTNHYLKGIRRALCSANSSTMLCMSIFFALSFAMEGMASPLSLSCPTVLLKWFLISFNLENERSEVATVTRRVQTSLNVVVTAGWLTRSIFPDRQLILLCYLVSKRGSKTKQLAREAGGDVLTVVLTKPLGSLV